MNERIERRNVVGMQHADSKPCTQVDSLNSMKAYPAHIQVADIAKIAFFAYTLPNIVHSWRSQISSLVGIANHLFLALFFEF